MTRIISFIKTKSHIFFISLLSIASILTFASAQTLTENVATNETTQIIPTTTIAPAISLTITPAPTVQVAVITVSPATPVTIAKQSITLTPTIPIITNTPTPTHFPPTVSSTLAIETVAVTLVQPNGTQNLIVTWRKDMNACDVLEQAKEEGAIASLTLDESYVSTFKSPYVYEINGYKNNWVFEINGKTALGCALVTIEKDDVIEWTYL